MAKTVELLVLLTASVVWGQQYAISTVAGGAPPTTPAAAVNTPIGNPIGIGVDSTGNVYFTSLNCVFKMDKLSILTRVAGTAQAGYSGDGGPAINARLNSPSGVAVDSGGNVFVADTKNERIRKISPTGTITTVAGKGSRGFSGDGGRAGDAQLSSPAGVAIDGSGRLLIADTSNGRIRRVTSSGIITTVAGTGGRDYSGDAGPAVRAHLFLPSGVAVDRVGNIFIADSFNNRIRKIDVSGTISTVAGNGPSVPSGGYSGDGGAAVNAQLWTPDSVAVDGSGNLFIADYRNNRIRLISSRGTITTFAGTGVADFSGDGGKATSAHLSPLGVAVDRAGNVFVADSLNERIRRVAVNGIIMTAAGNGLFPGHSGDGGQRSTPRSTIRGDWP